MILKELLGCIDDRTSELAALRAEVARLRKERDELFGQVAPRRRRLRDDEKTVRTVIQGNA